ncbi:MAG: hypothetical protein Q7T55_11495, partial [Solirubrobacteraceae bacterium]|nr:hypothetical protein [Solirubrobacteraceae bacterium]
GAQSGVGGGGRYDGLVEQLGGPSTPGCGWATGIERLLLAAGPNFAAQTREPLLYLAAEADPAARRTAFALAAQLRAAGHRIDGDLAGRSVNAQLKAAGRSGARYVAVVRGEDDIVLRGRGLDDRDLTVAEVPEVVDGLGLAEAERHHIEAQLASPHPSEPTSPGAPSA